MMRLYGNIDHSIPFGLIEGINMDDINSTYYQPPHFLALFCHASPWGRVWHPAPTVLGRCPHSTGTAWA